ncbi:MAG: terminase family protein [Clostridiales bacterium]|nr:terminase family protein [Clostridiales bacterium]MBQ1570994.1 terminase family protein [Clostridiales bacterium]
MVKTKSKSSSTVRFGAQEPTYRISPEYDTTELRAVKLLKAGGLLLDPWQSNILDDWMATNAGNKWVSKTCGGSVPRQNGKSLLVQGRANVGMLTRAERVIYTAHLQKTATETFEEMAAFFDQDVFKKYVKDIKTAIGREQIILNNGARIKFLARTRNGGRGQHGDLLIFDEAQELDESQQASFIPAISASLNPQTIYVGTPPDDTAVGVVFRKIRTSALDGDTKSTAWFEYSVPNIGDVSDRDRWFSTNPALGRRIMLSTIEGELEQMSEDTFARERLGWWTPIVEHRIDYAIDSELWDSCKSDELKPEGKTAYGVKFSADGSEVVLCGAVIPKDGLPRISLIDRKPTGYGTQWLADWLNDRYDKACCVVIDGRNGVDVLIDKISGVWRMKGSVLRPTAKDMIAAVSLLMDSLTENTVTWYSQQLDLRESAVTATRRPISGGWGFGGDNSCPIEACALALWGCKNSRRDPSRKMRIG